MFLNLFNKNAITFCLSSLYINIYEEIITAAIVIINNIIDSIILLSKNNRAGIAIIQDKNPTFTVAKIQIAISLTV